MNDLSDGLLKLGLLTTQGRRGWLATQLAITAGWADAGALRAAYNAHPLALDLWWDQVDPDVIIAQARSGRVGEPLLATAERATYFAYGILTAVAGFGAYTLLTR